MQSENLSVNLSAAKPRMQKHADKPGAYVLVIESSQPEAYPGESIILKLFFTGYGAISSPKLHITMPPGLHDPDESYMFTDLSKTQDAIVFGGTKASLGSRTYILQGATGPIAHPWDEPTFMIDVSNTHGMILTEATATRAPFEMEIKIKERTLRKYITDRKSRLRSGSHNIKFVFTYYNGESWVNEQTTHAIKVSSWYQQHLLLTWILGILLTIAALIFTIFGFT